MKSEIATQAMFTDLSWNAAVLWGRANTQNVSFLLYLQGWSNISIIIPAELIKPPPLNLLAEILQYFLNY